MKQNEELARARSALSAAGCDFALLSSVANVTYISGFEAPHAIGVMAVTVYAGPFAALSVGDGTAWLAVSQAYAAQARQESRLNGLLMFDGLDSFKPSDPRGTYLEAVRNILVNVGLGKTGTLGIESNALPHGAAECIARHFPNVKLVDAIAALENSRLIKTAREIALLRAAAHIGDVGQNALRELAKEPGRNEFDLWAGVTARMSQAAGHEIPVIGELVTGPRAGTCNYPGGPCDRVTMPGDAVLMDISQRVGGYWSDVTNTHVVGMEPTAHQKKFARISQDAFDAACAALRPGKLASEVWAAANNVYVKNGLTMPHYMGHQIGVVVNESPRIVPYDHTPIQAGMVFSLEPGVYEGPFGARSEKMALVTETGPEILSKFAWGI